MQQLPCRCASLSPSLNLPVPRCNRPQQGLATCSPLYRSSKRHLSLRLSRCAPRTRAQASLGESSARGNAKGNAEEKADDNTQPSSGFFDREFEQEALQSRLTRAPTGILVITGPRSSGKTALLKHVLARREGSGVNALVDGRSAQLSTPEDLRRALTAGDGLVPQLFAWLSAKLGDQSVTKAFKSLGATAVGRGLNASDPAVLTETVKTALAAAGAVPGSSSSVAVVTQVIEKLCAAGKDEAATSKSWPVFVFDEVNVLVKWQEGSEGTRNDLDTLLACLVRVTKQESQAHVVLATSDYSFAAWLAKAVGDKFFNVEVVGDFPKDEARKFFERELFEAAAQAPVLQDAAKRAAAASDTNAAPADASAVWEKVYEVCGGNPGDLRKVAVELSSAPSLEEVDAALLGVWSYILDVVETAATSGQGWTPRQYLTAVKMLLQSGHGAVIKADLRAALGDGGDAALLAMVKEGLLGLRAPSDWARDLPPEAYGDERRPVVTAASATHLYCMRRLFGERGKGAAERLRALDGEKAAPTEGSSADSPAQDELQRDIGAVAGKIDAVERDIAKVGDEIEAVKATKEEGWQEEVCALRKEKEQLRKKEEQLREELLLLRR